MDILVIFERLKGLTLDSTKINVKNKKKTAKKPQYIDI